MPSLLTLSLSHSVWIIRTFQNVAISNYKSKENRQDKWFTVASICVPLAESGCRGIVRNPILGKMATFTHLGFGAPQGGSWRQCHCAHFICPWLQFLNLKCNLRFMSYEKLLPVTKADFLETLLDVHIGLSSWLTLFVLKKNSTEWI